jgi:hypothetical protein
MIVIFFTFIALKTSNATIEKESKYIRSNLLNIPILKDMNINKTDELVLSDFNCDELKQLLDTKGKNVAVYLEDENGNVVPIIDKYCLGCSGINISGISCGDTFCTLTTCAIEGKDCGMIDNGCHTALLNCGSCTLPKTCGGSGTSNVCGS